MKLQLKYSERLQKNLERAIDICNAGHIYVNRKKGIIYVDTAQRVIIHSMIRRSDILPNEANIITLCKCLML